jgi:hypothetical protein
MAISPATTTNATAPQSQGEVTQAAQVLVLKKAIDIQAAGVATLLQALPLATSGNLGTRVNTLA